MMSEEYEKKRTVAIDADTDEGLDWLKTQLDSPKSWILRRLVRAEIERVKGGKQK